MVAVDIFQKTPERDDEAEFDENCGAFEVSQYVRKVKGYSHDRRIYRILSQQRFDFIFHDAEHTYQGVLLDILDYEPLLKVGGFISFHDYVDKWTLKQGVDDFFEGNPYFRRVSLTESLICFKKIAEPSRLRRSWYRGLLLSRLLRMQHGYRWLGRLIQRSLLT